jgi:hypothetical protein
MKDWPELQPDRELERADILLDQADALLRRHHAHEEPEGGPADAWTPGAGLDDDLPILTEVVEGFEFPPETPASSLRPAAPFRLGSSPATAMHQGPEALDPPASAAATAVPLARAAAPSDTLQARLAERLVELDTEIAREIGAWVATEMPPILARELDQLAGRMQAEIEAHLRATLLPELSARLGRLLDLAADPGRTPDRPQDT